VGLVHANVTTFNKALTSLAQEVGWTIEYAALREAALMCRDAIIFTPPFAPGGGKGETKQYAAIAARMLGANCKTQDECDAVCLCEYARCVDLDIVV